MHELPHITVATIVERDGKFLMVRENSGGRLVYNQPAGHVEPSETLFDAALRETLEETAWRVELKQLLGIYQYTSAENGITYIRHCFIAKAIEPRTGTKPRPGHTRGKVADSERVRRLRI